MRTAAWIAVAGMLGVALAAPGPAPAMPRGNPPSVECGGFALYFKIDDIADTGIEPGVYTSTTPRVETNWDGQQVTITNVTAEGQAFDWAATELVARVAWKEAGSIFWSDAGLPGYTGSVADRIKNGISHVTFCGEAPTLTPTPTPTEPVITPTPTPTEPVITPTPTASPSASVEAATGTPRTTPPPTDARAATMPSSPAWSLVLILIATVMAVSLVVTSPRSRRR
jgi:hypothetical protein